MSQDFLVRDHLDLAVDDVVEPGGDLRTPGIVDALSVVDFDRLKELESDVVAHLVAMLRSHIAAYLPDALPEGCLFTVRDGPMYDNDIDLRWKSAGLPHVRLHDLGQFYASGLIAAGCDVVTVQRALGHSSATTTLNTYSHLWPTAEDRTGAAAAELMRDSLMT